MEKFQLKDIFQQQLYNCAKYNQILRQVRNNQFKELNIAGLNDSARALIISTLFFELKKTLIIIEPDNHAGIKLYQELQNLNSNQVYFYPSSEVLPYEQVLSSPDNTALQLDLLLNLTLTPNEPVLAVVAAPALIQRVLDQKTILDTTLNLKIKDTIEPSDLALSLVKLGYSKESIVTLRGEFSIKGDIFDIYPSCGKPFRIEFFDNEIESIRYFNIDSQRSIEEITQVKIPPRYWFIFPEENNVKQRFREDLGRALNDSLKNLDEQSSQTLRSIMEDDLVALAQGAYREATEYYAPFLYGKATTLTDYFHPQCILAIDEWDITASALKTYEEKLNHAYEEGTNNGRLLPLPDLLHKSYSQIQSQMETSPKIFFTNFALELSSGIEGQNHVIAFDCSSGERFNNNMNSFTAKVKELRASGYKITVSTEQPQRIMEILREWDCPAYYLTKIEDLDELNQDEQVENPILIIKQGFLGGFFLKDINLVSITDSEIFGLKRRPIIYRRPKEDKQFERFSHISDINVGDYVVHIKNGIGQFTGVQRITVDKQQREYLAIQYAGDDRLYVPVDQINLLSAYKSSQDNPPRLSKLGGAEWENTKRKVKKAIKDVATDLLNLNALRAKQEGFSCLPDTPWQYEMEEAFPYEETPDQWQAILDTKKDLESVKPMDRLICGDVGFGKTEVALRAIFKTVMSGKQAAILVPTTILAQQHFNTLSERFAPYPIRVGLLSRFRTASEQNQVIKRLSQGEIDVVVGTHRLIQKDIQFKDLGLLVIDEEQRFGVAHKEKLKQIRVIVDVLTMSATPIPRTLYMALSGAREMSVINTPPVNRSPIKTFVGEYKQPLVRTAILHEIERSGQVYFVHNRVNDIEQIAFELSQLVPEARIAIGHGQMQEKDLENVMLDFLSHEYDILVCTTIIESGLDIPNVNTIIIDESDKLGLSQLYQLRGRVGRSNVQAYAYCLYNGNKILVDNAQERLKAIREFSALGSGYQIALKDMEIRGVGNILGHEQHGHILAVGFDLYCKLLEESIAEVKGQSIERDADCQVDINITALIPETYIPDGKQRITEYKRLADVKNLTNLNKIIDEWQDRFGSPPIEALQLVKIIRIRILASSANILAIKPELLGLRLFINCRLPEWLAIQNKLPKHLSLKTVYKPGIPSEHLTHPYVLLRCEGLSPSQQLDIVEELIKGILSNINTPSKV